MNCYQHPNTPAVAYCRSCGRPLCVACQRPAEGTVFCVEHAPVTAYAAGNASAGSAPNPAPAAAVPPFTAPQPPPKAAPNPYTAPVPPPSTAPTALQTSPGLAFLLGLIPGVGAIYNGQYVKGLIHAVIFGLLLSITNASDTSSGQEFLAMCCVAFYAYMPFEAFHTARRRQLGLPLDEWSSLVAQNRISSSVPVGPIVLILIGTLFLLQSLHVLDFHAIGRYWPVILIVIGAAMLFSRLRPPVRVSSAVITPSVSADLGAVRDQ